MLGTKQRLSPIAGKIFDDVDVFATSVIAPPRITFRLLVRQNTSGGLHHRRACVVFAGDHLQAVFLPFNFGGDGGPYFGVLLLNGIHGFAIR